MGRNLITVFSTVNTLAQIFSRYRTRVCRPQPGARRRRRRACAPRHAAHACTCATQTACFKQFFRHACARTPLAAQARQPCVDGAPSRDVDVPESGPQPAGFFAPHKRRLRGTAQDFGSCADATNPAVTRRASVFAGSQSADLHGYEAWRLRPEHADAAVASKQNRPHVAAGRQFAASDAGVSDRRPRAARRSRPVRAVR